MLNLIFTSFPQQLLLENSALINSIVFDCDAFSLSIKTLQTASLSLGSPTNRVVGVYVRSQFQTQPSPLI
jgi:hypothetical protein